MKNNFETIIKQIKHFPGVLKWDRNSVIEFGIGASRCFAIFALMAQVPISIKWIIELNNQISMMSAIIVLFTIIQFVMFWYVFPVMHKSIQSINPFLIDNKKPDQQVDAPEPASPAR